MSVVTSFQKDGHVLNPLCSDELLPSRLLFPNSPRPSKVWDVLCSTHPYTPLHWTLLGSKSHEQSTEPLCAPGSNKLTQPGCEVPMFPRAIQLKLRAYIPTA
jgi:hypothetical protein